MTMTMTPDCGKGVGTNNFIFLCQLLSDLYKYIIYILYFYRHKQFYIPLSAPEQPRWASFYLGASFRAFPSSMGTIKDLLPFDEHQNDADDGTEFFFKYLFFSIISLEAGNCHIFERLFNSQGG